MCVSHINCPRQVGGPNVGGVYFIVVLMSVHSKKPLSGTAQGVRESEREGESRERLFDSQFADVT